MPTIVRLQQDGEDRSGPAFSEAPASAPIQRTLAVPDRIQSHGIDLAPVLGAGGGGLVWAAIREGDPIERAERADSNRRRRTSSLDPRAGHQPRADGQGQSQNTLVFVTRLDTGAPVPAAKVSIVNRRNETLDRHDRRRRPGARAQDPGPARSGALVAALVHGHGGKGR